MIHYTFSCFCFSPLATKISSDFLCIFIIYMFLINFICKSLERISSTICHIHFFFFIYYRHFCFCFIMPNCHRTLWHHDSFCFLLSHSGHPLQWRHNERDGVPNRQPHDCLLHYLFRCRSKKTLKLGVTGLCEGNSPVTDEFPTQRTSYTENVSIWWHHQSAAAQLLTCRKRCGSLPLSNQEIFWLFTFSLSIFLYFFYPF